MNEGYAWAQAMNCAVTVCDKNANIIFMNEKACEIFAAHGNLIGQNLQQCHPPRAWEQIQQLLKTGGSNAYTISKKGLKKMIYQTAWFQDGEVGGLVEISMVIPEQMPHFDRG